MNAFEALDHVEYHNAASIENSIGISGKQLSRLPRGVRTTLHGCARLGGGTSLSEVRFVTDSTLVEVNLFCNRTAVNCRVFSGNFEYQNITLEAGKINSILLTPIEKLNQIKPEWQHSKGFAPQVWRIVFCGGPIAVCGIELHGGSLRPPTKEEKPAQTLLAYGSSITQSDLDGYTSVAARRLGMDLINLGFGGACRVEAEMVDFICNCLDWDIAYIETGINMLNTFSPQEYKKRVRYLFSSLIKNHPNKLLVATTIYPFNEREGIVIPEKAEGSWSKDDIAYTQVLLELHREMNHPNFHLLNGEEIMDELTCLSHDIIHPCTYGNAVMGLNLANKLQNIISAP